MPEIASPPPAETLTPRQRKILLVMSAVLFLGGLGIMFFLGRLPLPARLGLGIIDVIVAAVLVVFLRQHSPPGPGK
jgi:cyanate permease